MLLLLAAAAGLVAGEGRFEQYTRQTAKDFGPSVTTLSAGACSGAGHERAVAGAFGADDRTTDHYPRFVSGEQAMSATFFTSIPGHPTHGES